MKTKQVRLNPRQLAAKPSAPVDNCQFVCLPALQPFAKGSIFHGPFEHFQPEWRAFECRPVVLCEMHVRMSPGFVMGGGEVDNEGVMLGGECFARVVRRHMPVFAQIRVEHVVLCRQTEITLFEIDIQNVLVAEKVCVFRTIARRSFPTRSMSIFSKFNTNNPALKYELI